jgi:cell division protein FtsL
MLAMACIAMAALLYLAEASQSSVLQYNIDALQAQRSQLSAQNANLQAQATSLSSIQRIGAEAADQLHMSRPGISSTIWLNPIVPWFSQPAIPTARAEILAAQRQSQPLAWMGRFLAFLESSL